MRLGSVLLSLLCACATNLSAQEESKLWEIRESKLKEAAAGFSQHAEDRLTVQMHDAVASVTKDREEALNALAEKFAEALDDLQKRNRQDDAALSGRLDALRAEMGAVEKDGALRRGELLGRLNVVRERLGATGRQVPALDLRLIELHDHVDLLANAPPPATPTPYSPAPLLSRLAAQDAEIKALKARTIAKTDAEIKALQKENFDKLLWLWIKSSGAAILLGGGGIFGYRKFRPKDKEPK